MAFPEDRVLPPSFTRFSSPRKRSTVPLLSSLNPFVRSSCTRTHAPHLPLILSFDPHRTFPRKFSSISRVGYILFRSTSRAPVLCPCFSLPPVPTPVHPCFSQRSSRFVGLNPLRVLTLSRIVLAWSTRLSSPPFLPVPVAPPVFLCSPCLARETFFVRGSFTWLNNDREKDRTFRLKEYRHAAIARLQRRHRETYAFTIHSLSLVSGYPVCSYHRFLVSVEVSRDELRLEFKVPALSVRSRHQASRPSVPAR